MSKRSARGRKVTADKIRAADRKHYLATGMPACDIERCDVDLRDFSRSEIARLLLAARDAANVKDAFDRLIAAKRVRSWYACNDAGPAALDLADEEIARAREMLEVLVDAAAEEG